MQTVKVSSKVSKMKNGIIIATESVVAFNGGLEPLLFLNMGVRYRLYLVYVSLFRRWYWQSLQWHFPFLSV